MIYVGLRKYDSTERQQRDLHILDAQERSKYKVILLTWKAIHLNESKILVNALPKLRKIDGLRSSQDHKKVGHLVAFSTKTTKSRFGYTSQYFNDLPKKIRDIDDVGQFESQLETYLFPST